MRTFIIAALTGLSASTAIAASPTPAEPRISSMMMSPSPYDPAPWWMKSPIIAATGEVQTHIPANRASFSARFDAVDASLSVASKTVAERVRTLARTLQAYGADKAQVETSLSITPIYQQYRDKQGELQSNERADRVDHYQASVSFRVEVRDLSVLERAYAAVMSAHPASIQPVYFSLEPENETNTELFKAATADAARRARLAVEAAGAHLGRVMLIDPSARACEADELVSRAPRIGGEDAGGVQDVVVTAQKRAQFIAPPPPPAPGAEVAPGDILPLQPPLQALDRKICVIYALE
jgi:uncharacterized protein YggE